MYKIIISQLSMRKLKQNITKSCLPGKLAKVLMSYQSSCLYLVHSHLLLKSFYLDKNQSRVSAHNATDSVSCVLSLSFK